MKIIDVEEPEDLIFPLDRETWENPDIFYHGSSRIYSSQIEKNGFVMGWRPFDINEISNFVENYRKIDDFLDIDPNDPVFWNAYGTCETYAHTSSETISFSRNYWQAAHFGNKNGGETVEAIIDFLQFLSRMYENKTKVFHPISEEDGKLFDKLNSIANEILTKYQGVITEHKPCVYVVELDDEQDHYRDEQEIEKSNNGYRIKNFHVTRSIPKESIIARIDFPNGGYTEENLWENVLRDEFKEKPLNWKKR